MIFRILANMIYQLTSVNLASVITVHASTTVGHMRTGFSRSCDFIKKIEFMLFHILSKNGAPQFLKKKKGCPFSEKRTVTTIQC